MAPTRPSLLPLRGLLAGGLILSLAVNNSGAQQPPPAPSGRAGIVREIEIIVTARDAPIADAIIDFGGGREQRTDDSGSTRRSFPGGSQSRTAVSFVVRAPGFATEASTGGIGDGTTVRKIELLPETPLVGRVLDPSGRPVADVSVTAHPDGLWRGPAAGAVGRGCFQAETIASSRTDPDGRFSLSSLGVTRRYRIVAAPSDRSFAWVETTIDGGATPLDITLPAAGRLDAEIELPQQSPAMTPGSSSLMLRRLECSENGPGTALMLQWRDPVTGDWRIVRGSRSAEGTSRIRIRFDQVPPGVVRLRSTIGPGVAADLSEAIEIAAGEPSTVLMHLLPVRRLRVAVVDEQRAPVAGARVEVTRMPGPEFGISFGNTDANGIIDFEVHPRYDVPVKVLIGDEVALSTVIAAGTEPPPPIVVGRRAR